MAAEHPTSSPGVDVGHLMLIVIGAHLRAEMADRPLGYKLADTITAWLRRQSPRLNVRFVPVVCSDIWYMNQEILQRRPTISIGGPGVNALSAYYAQKLNPAVVNDNQLIIQLDPEFIDLRVCLWGMNHELTIAALDHFVTQYLDGYLHAVATQVEPRVD